MIKIEFDVTKATPEEIDAFTAERTEELPHNCPPHPTVSICMVTFNHERFISQAIESVLMQETDFLLELVIGEDCSTDNTRNIVLRYKNEHPDRIPVFLSTENLGQYTGNGRLNFVRNFKACRGKYIALLEGDDYWTDPHKLQKQVDFLDSHPECSVCYHNTLKFDDDGSRIARKAVPPGKRKLHTIKDILVMNDIQTSSVMYRNGFVRTFPEWFYELYMGDWPLHILHAEHGSIGYLDEVMSAHRLHAGGVWSTMSEIHRTENRIRAQRRFNAHLNYRFNGIVKKALAEQYHQLASSYMQAGDLFCAGDRIIRCISQSPSTALRISLQSLSRTFPRVFECFRILKRRIAGA
ncbi:MAG: glycosyltransferase [Thermodesulfobacteriota bacterium]|nr:glycosyltransferase [Thermodesulfobacteriota bacterium]